MKLWNIRADVSYSDSGYKSTGDIENIWRQKQLEAFGVRQGIGRQSAGSGIQFDGGPYRRHYSRPATVHGSCQLLRRELVRF